MNEGTLDMEGDMKDMKRSTLYPLVVALVLCAAPSLLLRHDGCLCG